MSPMSPGSHFISMSYTSSQSMHYVSPLSPRSHQASTPFPFSYFGRSGPLWAIRATIWTTPRSIHFQTINVPSEPWEPLHTNVICIHLAARCTMCPHWASGGTRLQRPFYLAILDVPGPMWAIGAAIWTISRSIHFQTFYVPNEP